MVRIDGVFAGRHKSKIKRLRGNKFLRFIAVNRLISIFSIFLIFGLIAGTVFSQTNLASGLRIYQNLPDGRYLILLQNSHELRPTGGFIGTVAEAELKNRKLINLNFETNIYKRDDYYAPQLGRTAPEPLQDFLSQNPKPAHHFFALRDSNWDPDWPTSAQLAQWFWQNEGGNSTVGVIGITSQALVDLLGFTGPIYEPASKQIIDQNNFYDILQKTIEADYFTERSNKISDEPKTILRDFIPELETQAGKMSLFNLQNWFLTSLKQKNILLYFSDPQVSALAKSEGWDGDITRPGAGDRLLVVNANLGGGKTSHLIRQEIDYQVVNQDKSRAKLKISRVYQSPTGTEGQANHNWLRIYVPSGSAVNAITLNAKDIKSDIKLISEHGYLIIGLEMDLGPAESKILEIDLSNPAISTSRPYQLTVLKQPGSEPDRLRVTIGNRVLFNSQQKTDLKLRK